MYKSKLNYDEYLTLCGEYLTMYGSHLTLCSH